MEPGPGRTLAIVGVGAYALSALMWIVHAFTRDSAMERDAPRLFDAANAWTATDAGLVLAGTVFALLALAGVGRPILLWRIAGTFLALHLITFHAVTDLIWRALAPWPGLPEDTMLVAAWIRIGGQALLVATPWLAGRAWRTTGLVLLAAAIARFAANLLFWADEPPEAAWIFQECVTMVALFVVGVTALSGMGKAGRHTAVALGSLVLVSALAFLPGAIENGMAAPGVAALVFEAMAGFVLLTAWALPILAKMATPHPEPSA